MFRIPDCPVEGEIKTSTLPLLAALAEYQIALWRARSKPHCASTNSREDNTRLPCGGRDQNRAENLWGRILLKSFKGISITKCPS